MARVYTVKKARKDYPEFGIKKEDAYYWWKFNFGPVVKSKTYPKRSQLTRSGFYANLFDLEDDISRFMASDPDECQVGIDEFVERVQELIDQCQESLDNMPEQLQDGSESGQLLQERISELESWQADIENINTDIDESEIENEEGEDNKEAKRQDLVDEIVAEINDMAGNHSIP
jgi:septal ring factor EnvC (AmiA/AmiB activator)